MAINVNTVYQTVLLILNKEQRGYITPDEFNKIATQVQLSIFEKYFEDLNVQLRSPGFEDEYADRVDQLEEKISIFKEYGAAGYYSDYFYLPANTHRIGTIMYKDEQELQMTNRGELLRLDMSKLTRPTKNYPMYIQEGKLDVYENGIIVCEDCFRVYVYPKDIKEDITISYIRKPKNVVWGYGLGAVNQYIWDGSPSFNPPSIPATGSVNFELHESEQVEVILKILMYSGVVIRDPQIIQAAAAEAQQIDVSQQQ